MRWESDGRGSYTLETAEVPERGTTIVLHLREGEDDLLNDYRLRSIIQRYSDHISLPILMPAQDGGEPAAVNKASALWARPKSELTDQDYQDFFRHIASDFTDPLAWLHARIEGTYEYTLLLYIPSRAPFDLWVTESRRGVKLHVRRVFIMDDNGQLLPLYLRFVRGVIDSADLPLNVSRELLQGSRVVDNIRSTATKRVLRLLRDLAADQPDKYASFWKEFGAVLKEGVAEDYANRDEIAGLLRFTSTRSATSEADVSLADYVARMKQGQEKIYYLLAPTLGAAASSPHLEAYRDKDIEVLLLGQDIDNWVVTSLTEFDGRRLQSVAQGAPDFGALAGETRAPGPGAGQHAVRGPAGPAQGGPGGQGLGRPGDQPPDHLAGLHRGRRAGDRHQPGPPDARHGAAQQAGAGDQPRARADPAAAPRARRPARPAAGRLGQRSLQPGRADVGGQDRGPQRYVTQLNDLLEGLTGTGTGPAQMTDEAGTADELPFRYGARLAEEIELRWQEHWAAAGTFDTPNPAGPLADRVRPVRGPPEVLRAGHVPVPERRRAARRPPARLHRAPTSTPATCG